MYVVCSVQPSTQCTYAAAVPWSEEQKNGTWFFGIYLDSVVFLVANVDETQCIRCNTPRVAELSIDSSLTAKSPYEVSSCVKNLNTMVVSVSNDVLANFVDSNTSQAIKFALTIAITTKTEPMLPMFIEHLNTMIGRIGYNY